MFGPSKNEKEVTRLTAEIETLRKTSNTQKADDSKLIAGLTKTITELQQQQQQQQQTAKRDLETNKNECQVQLNAKSTEITSLQTKIAELTTQTTDALNASVALLGFQSYAAKLQTDETNKKQMIEKLNDMIAATNEHIKQMSVYKKQIDSKLWIIPRIPLDVNHPLNYEVVAKENLVNGGNYYIQNGGIFTKGILRIENTTETANWQSNNGPHNVHDYYFTNSSNNREEIQNRHQSIFYKLKEGYQTPDELEFATCYKAAQLAKQQQGGKSRKSYKSHKKIYRKSKCHRK